MSHAAVKSFDRRGISCKNARTHPPYVIIKYISNGNQVVEYHDFMTETNEVLNGWCSEDVHSWNFKI